MNDLQRERWRTVNASSARYVRLSIGGSPFQILGTDGGQLETPVTATEVLLAAADRVAVAVEPFEEGERLANPTGAPQDDHAACDRHDADVAHDGLRHQIQPAPWNGSMVNKELYHRDDPVKVGELQVWDVVNSTLMDHQFHLHGFCFQVLSVNGKAPAWPSWEDVVNLPQSTTRIGGGLRFPARSSKDPP